MGNFVKGKKFTMLFTHNLKIGANYGLQLPHLSLT